MNMACSESQGGPDPQVSQSGGHGPAGELAPERMTLDAGDPDRQGFSRVPRLVRQEGQVDEVADPKPANLLAQLDVVDPFPAAHFLDVLDQDAVSHAGSFHPP